MFGLDDGVVVLITHIDVSDARPSNTPAGKAAISFRRRVLVQDDDPNNQRIGTEPTTGVVFASSRSHKRNGLIRFELDHVNPVHRNTRSHYAGRKTQRVETTVKPSGHGHSSHHQSERQTSHATERLRIFPRRFTRSDIHASHKHGGSCLVS